MWCYRSEKKGGLKHALGTHIFMEVEELVPLVTASYAYDHRKGNQIREVFIPKSELFREI